MHILAVDIGTTGAKAALVGRDGAVLASGYADYPLFTGEGNVVEQEPEDWWRATCQALDQLWSAQPGASASLAGVILSGQMQDAILLGAKGALGRAILYSDQRAQAEAQELARRVDPAELVAITGNEQGPASLLAKWLWLARHQPERLAAARTILLGAQDYVAWRLCGRASTDLTTASTTGLLALFEGEWAGDLLDRLGLDPGKLPMLRPSGAPLGQVHPAGAEATGIPAGTPLFQGVGDLGAATVGVGAGLPGRLYAYLGTSGWVAATAVQAQPAPERGLFLLRHPEPEHFIPVAPMLTAGGNLEWLRGVLAEDAPLAYDALNRLAQDAPPGSRGLLYLPYLAGERSPFSDPHARACFLGLSPSTGRAEMVRAVMEGTALAYRSLDQALGVAGSGPMLLAGGGARSPLWCQILADVLDRPVHVVADASNAPARGAAVIAGRSLGWYDSLLPTDRFFPVSQIYQPNPEHRALYDGLYAVFQGLYPQLRESFQALAGLAR